VLIPAITEQMHPAINNSDHSFHPLVPPATPPVFKKYPVYPALLTRIFSAIQSMTLAISSTEQVYHFCRNPKIYAGCAGKSDFMPFAAVRQLRHITMRLQTAWGSKEKIPLYCRTVSSNRHRPCHPLEMPQMQNDVHTITRFCTTS